MSTWDDETFADLLKPFFPDWETMNASKENGRTAADHLTQLRAELESVLNGEGIEAIAARRHILARVLFVEGFVERAIAKLPTEKAYAAEADRREKARADTRKGFGAIVLLAALVLGLTSSANAQHQAMLIAGGGPRAIINTHAGPITVPLVVSGPFEYSGSAAGITLRVEVPRGRAPRAIATGTNPGMRQEYWGPTHGGLLLVSWHAEPRIAMSGHGPAVGWPARTRTLVVCR